MAHATQGREDLDSSSFDAVWKIIREGDRQRASIERDCMKCGMPYRHRAEKLGEILRERGTPGTYIILDLSLLQ